MISQPDETHNPVEVTVLFQSLCPKSSNKVGVNFRTQGSVAVHWCEIQKKGKKEERNGNCEEHKRMAQSKNEKEKN